MCAPRVSHSRGADLGGPGRFMVTARRRRRLETELSRKIGLRCRSIDRVIQRQFIKTSTRAMALGPCLTPLRGLYGRRRARTISKSSMPAPFRRPPSRAAPLCFDAANSGSRLPTARCWCCHAAAPIRWGKCPRRGEELPVGWLTGGPEARHDGRGSRRRSPPTLLAARTSGLVAHFWADNLFGEAAFDPRDGLVQQFLGHAGVILGHRIGPGPAQAHRWRALFRQ
jgi:hypothetical protein